MEMSHIDSSVMEKVDMVFPVLGKVGDRRLHGYHFIPLIEAPRVYYITHANHHVLRDVILSCLSLWPLLLVTALMVLISGIRMAQCSFSLENISYHTSEHKCISLVYTFVWNKG